MTTLQKIQAAFYAIGKRMQGYHLLRNPKGVSQTEVNMIKEKTGVSPYYDDMFSIIRIRKIFAKNGNHEIQKELFSTHLYDTRITYARKTNPLKKNINYSVSGDGIKFVNVSSENFPVLQKGRIRPKLSKVRSEFGIKDSEYDLMRLAKEDAAQKRKYYKTHYPFLIKILSLGKYEKICYPLENRPNFFKVLYQNLTNQQKL